MTLTWSAPGSDGGAAITGYNVTVSTSADGAYTDAASCSNLGRVTTCTATGLSNRAGYYFKVAARNSIGLGGYSNASAVFTPLGTPGAPGVASSSGVGDGTVTLTWTAPTDTGGSAITGYNVTVSTNSSAGFSDATGCTGLGVVLTCTAAGLTNGTPYYFKVAAVNPQGVGEPSSAGGPFTPLTTPDAPNAVSATAGNLDAAVSWTAPQSDGGSPLVSYTATAVADGETTQSCTSNSGTPIAPSCTITNLVNDVNYSVSVIATNGVGASQPSAPTSVTPVTPCVDGGPCAVGDLGPAGGTVFYVSETPQTWGSYLEAAPKTWAGSDDPYHDWGSGSCETSGGGATETAIGTGRTNTTTVRAECANGQYSPAASAAYAYSGGGKSDWFLPSKDELAAMVAQRESLELADDLYWSSSNSSDRGDDAYAQETWGAGSAYLDLKDQAWMVRPVRQFGPSTQCTVGGPCGIGETGPGGGTVVYVADSLQSWGRYLEVAPAGWSGTADDPSYAWGLSACTNAAITTSTAIGTGAVNTTTAINSCAAGASAPAAKAARDYTGGSKSDWYLPSKDEVSVMTRNPGLLGGQPESIVSYWSSSVSVSSGDGLAWLQEIDFGTTPVSVYTAFNEYRYVGNQVRPIRAF